MIKSIGLRNFKCFENQVIDLGGLTLLSGLNGTGKSTVLQSLLLLRQSYEQRMLLDTGLALNGSLLCLGTGRDALFEWAPAEEVIVMEIQWADADRARFSFGYQQETDVLMVDDSSIHPTYENHALFTDDFHYLQAERLGPRTSYDMAYYLVRQHRQLGCSGEFTPFFLETFGGNDIPNPILTHENAVSLGIKDQAEAWLGEICPGIRLQLDSHSRMDRVTLSYPFTNGDDVSNAYRPTNVGFGVSYALPIVVAILSARKNSLVLIENPEAHLHPRGQAEMGRLLARAAGCGVQVVVETHSDHVLNGIRLSVHQGIVQPGIVQLHFFSRDHQSQQPRVRIESPRLDANGRINRWPDGFFDEWDKSLEGLLESGGNLNEP